MKRMIVIVLVIFLIAGGVGGGLIMMGIIPNPFNPQEQSASSPPLMTRKLDLPQTALTLVKPNDLILPVIINGQLTRRIYVTSRLSIQPGQESVVRRRMSEYQDDVISGLVPYFQKYFMEHDTLDLVEVKKRLNGYAKGVYGDTVREVLLINVFEQGGSTVR